MEISTLIDRACENVVGGTRAELARVLGAKAPHISNWAHSGRPIPLDQHIHLCRLAGLSSDETLAHLSEVAGAQPPKHRGVAASFVLAAVGAAGLAAMSGTLASWLKATIYRPSMGRGELRYVAQ